MIRDRAPLAQRLRWPNAQGKRRNPWQRHSPRGASGVRLIIYWAVQPVKELSPLEEENLTLEQEPFIEMLTDYLFLDYHGEDLQFKIRLCIDHEKIENFSRLYIGKMAEEWKQERAKIRAQDDVF